MPGMSILNSLVHYNPVTGFQNFRDLMQKEPYMHLMTVTDPRKRPTIHGSAVGVIESVEQVKGTSLDQVTSVKRGG